MKTSKTNILAKLKDRVTFSESYSEKDFKEACKNFEIMAWDLSPMSKEIFASWQILHLEELKRNSFKFNLKLINKKKVISFNPENIEWYKSLPKQMIRKLKKHKNRMIDKLKGKKEVEKKRKKVD